MIFNPFKKTEKPKEPAKEAEVKKEVKEEKPATLSVRAAKQKATARPELLLSPQVTEKATQSSEKNQYIFRVERHTNKPEIKKTIESMYRVEITGVKIINVPAKKRRLGRSFGWTKGYKKAIVKVKEGQKIDLITA